MSKRKVLLVDDEPAFCRVMRAYLETTGKYEVQIESDSTKAISAARKFMPDVVVLDVIMPDMDGGDIAARMKADARLRRVPFVFLTATVSKEEVRKHGDVIGGQKFLAKPVDAEELVSCIEEVLDEAA